MGKTTNHSGKIANQKGQKSIKVTPLTSGGISRGAKIATNSQRFKLPAGHVLSPSKIRVLNKCIVVTPPKGKGKTPINKRIRQTILSENMILPTGGGVEPGDDATIGILLADWGKSSVKDCITILMDYLDKKSGRYFDFNIIGYVDSVDELTERKHLTNPPEPAFILERTDKAYYFDRLGFNSDVLELEELLGFKYTGKPMLILVEVLANRGYGMLEYQSAMTIELDKFGIEDVALLFDKIIEISKETIELKAFKRQLTLKCLKGKWLDLLYNDLKKDKAGNLKALLKAITLFKIDNKRTVNGIPVSIE